MLYLILLGFSLLSFSTQALAETVYISAAASMTDVVNRVIAKYVAQNPDVAIQPNFASSGNLAKQIEQGAPADVFISANPKWMEYCIDKGLVHEKDSAVLAINSLVFVSDKTLPDASMEKLPQLERIAMGSPESVPAGKYAQKAMESADVYDLLVDTKKLIFTKDVRQALLYAERGEVDGAFIYRTDAFLAHSTEIQFAVPQELYPQVSYLIGLTVQGAGNDAAQSFLPSSAVRRQK